MSARDGVRAAGAPESVVWHEVECGRYAADLALWSELASECAGSVLELGCGSGRVALRLARDGFEVTGLDRDAELIAELRRRADAADLAVEARIADVRELDHGGRFGLVAAPMQLVHLLGGPRGRAAMLRGAAEHLEDGGALAVSVLGEDAAGAFNANSRLPPLPDVRELDRWVYSSLPVDVRAVEGGLEVHRLRQVVSPAGRLRETLDVTRLDAVSCDSLAEEAIDAGLRERKRLDVPPTPEHVGSTVLVLEGA